MAGEEDDDYMGDLSRFITDSKPHPAPSAKHTVSEQQQSNRGKAKQRWQERRKQSREAENEKRAKALSSAIPSSNIGFKMLQQMGYKPGEALGKHGQGALEPLKVELKRSRTGLGVDELQRQNKAKASRQLELQQQLKHKLDDITREDFLDRQKTSWHAGKILRDFRRARAALAQLDEDHSILQEKQKKQKKLEEDDAGDGDKEEEVEEEVITDEDLQRILEELRRRFFYCIYCGCKYDSATQMESSCPGMDEDSH